MSDIEIALLKNVDLFYCLRYLDHIDKINSEKNIICDLFSDNLDNMNQFSIDYQNNKMYITLYCLNLFSQLPQINNTTKNKVIALAKNDIAFQNWLNNLTTMLLNAYFHVKKIVNPICNYDFGHDHNLSMQFSVIRNYSCFEMLEILLKKYINYPFNLYENLGYWEKVAHNYPQTTLGMHLYHINSVKIEIGPINYHEYYNYTSNKTNMVILNRIINNIIPKYMTYYLAFKVEINTIPPMQLSQKIPLALGKNTWLINSLNNQLQELANVLYQPPPSVYELNNFPPDHD